MQLHARAHAENTVKDTVNQNRKPRIYLLPRSRILNKKCRISELIKKFGFRKTRFCTLPLNIISIWEIAGLQL